MSEYHYYEFLAIDRALSPGQIAELRSISTRATITPTSFTNDYQWGDLKADSNDLLARYFDVRVFMSCWMYRTVAFRVPGSCIKSEDERRFRTKERIRFIRVGDDVIVEFSAGESAPIDGEDEGSGWMASLAPIREALVSGDKRSLFIAWLAEAAGDDSGDEWRIGSRPRNCPPVPEGMKEIDAAHRALADYLFADQFAMEAAGEFSKPVAPSLDDDALRSGIERMSDVDKDALLFLLARDGGRKAQMELLAALRAEGSPRPGARKVLGPAFCLIEARAASLRREAEDREAKRRAAESRRAAEESARLLDQRIAALSAHPRKEWEKVRTLASRGNAAAYDAAVSLVEVLREMHVRKNEADVFASELAALREAFSSKRAFMARLDRVSGSKG